MPQIKRQPPTQIDRERGFFTLPYRPHHTSYCCIYCQWDTLNADEIGHHVANHFEKEREAERRLEEELRPKYRPLEVPLYDAGGKPIAEIEVRKEK